MEILWEKLKSGSDIRGTAAEGVEGQHIELTDEAVTGIALGYVKFLSKQLNKNANELIIALGRDSRISGPRINECVQNAFLSCGVTVYSSGLSSTPAMFMSTLKEVLNADASVMITASHHPFNKNGLKFFTKDGGLEGCDITEILSYAKASDFCEKTCGGKVVDVPLMDLYSKILADKVRTATGLEKPLSGLKIIVDAGNGAGGFYVEKVLKPLGADTEGSQFLTPDGMFPNHVPNPENKEAMQSICSAVIGSRADFGIIFDTDVDRAGAVSASGEEINRNRLIALISAILLEEKTGAYIVTDSITSDGLAEFIAEKGGIHHRFKRGYKNVINEAIKLNSEGKYCPLAIETSGHAALKENYFLDDGAYLVTRLIIKLAQLHLQGKTLDYLTDSLKQAKEEAEIRMGFKTADFKAYGQKVIDELKDYALTNKNFKVAPVNNEGLRVSFDKGVGDGWFLLRLSVHDPIMPLNIESNTAGGTLLIAKQLYEFLSRYDNLNIDTLKAFVGA